MATYTQSDSQLAFYGIQKQREQLEREKLEASERRSKIASLTAQGAKLTASEWNTRTKELMNMDVDQPVMDQRKTIIDSSGKQVANPNFQKQAVNPVTNEPMTKSVKMYEADPEYVKGNILKRWITPPGGRVQQTAEAEKYQDIIDDYATRGEAVPEDLVPESAWDAIDSEGSESLIFGENSMVKNAWRQSRLGGGQGYIRPGAPDRPDVPVEMETEVFDEFDSLAQGSSRTAPIQASPVQVQATPKTTITPRELRREPLSFDKPEKIDPEFSIPDPGYEESIDENTVIGAGVASQLPSAWDKLSTFSGEGGQARAVELGKFLTETKVPHPSTDRFGANWWGNEPDTIINQHVGQHGTISEFTGEVYDTVGVPGYKDYESLGWGDLSFDEYRAKNLLNFEAMGKEAGLLDETGQAIAAVDSGDEMAKVGTDLASSLDSQKVKLIEELGEEGAKELGVEVAEEAGGSMLGTAVGAAGTAYGAWNLSQNWDDMSGVDKTLGATSTTLSAASLVPGPHQPFTAIGSLAVGVLDYFWD